MKKSLALLLCITVAQAFADQGFYIQNDNPAPDTPPSAAVSNYNVGIQEMKTSKLTTGNSITMICVNNVSYIINNSSNGTSITPALSASGRPAGCFSGYN